MMSRVSCVLTLLIALVAASPLLGADGPDGAPMVVPGATQYDLTSKITGRTYRLMVSVPFKADPSVAYPVFYVLDGNYFFNTAADAERMQASSGISAPAIVVGIGYPDSAQAFGLRLFDLTPSVSTRPEDDRVALIKPEDAATRTGGGDAFLRCIEEEVKPFVAARFKVDPTQQALYGDSLGGLLALRVLFTNPKAFSTFIITSPSIWWNERDVLAGEKAFAKRARAGELRLKILVISAGDEQHKGDAPKQPAGANQHPLTPEWRRMVDNASELANRLAALDPKDVRVVRTIFSGEVHTSVQPASISRGLRFAFPPK
jgi:hypothetical protein